MHGRAIRLPIVLIILLSIAACANPSYKRFAKSLSNTDVSVVAILPFTGEVRYAALATDTFTLQMIGIEGVKVIQPDDVRLTIRRMGLSPNDGVTVLEATKVASALGATSIIQGNAAGYTNGVTLNGFSTVKIINVKSGEIVAAIHEPSGLLIANSVEQTVISAVSRTARTVRRLLENQAKNQNPKQTEGTERVKGKET